MNFFLLVFGITNDGYIPLVRQYRPALEKYTLELPGGVLDEGENPEDGIKREVVEETGYKVVGNLKLLGCLAPDTGRLENNLWCYFGNLELVSDYKASVYQKQ